MHTLFGIIFWNNCAWLNMFCALSNAAHFEGQWVWRSFYISFYNDGTPQAPRSVHPYLHTQGPGWSRVCRSYTLLGYFLFSLHCLRLSGSRRDIPLSYIICHHGANCLAFPPLARPTNLGLRSLVITQPLHWIASQSIYIFIQILTMVLWIIC